MDRKTIGERLKKCRGSRSIAEVAEAVDISASALSMYENGRRLPKDDVKVKLAAYYKMSVQKLFYAE